MRFLFWFLVGILIVVLSPIIILLIGLDLIGEALRKLEAK